MTGHQPFSHTSINALAYCLEARDNAGRRKTVPVFGNGLNAQAFAESSNPLGDPWNAALKEIVSELSMADQRRIRRFPRFHHAVFDELNRCYDKPKRYKGTTSKFMIRLSRSLKRHSRRGRQLSLYHEVHVSEFPNILTTCIDETFPDAIEASRRKPPGVYYEWELYRKSVLRLGDRSRPTDIWQMNGSVVMPDGIRLGTFRNAEIIAELEYQRIRLMNAWRSRSGGLLRPADFAQMNGPFAFNWFKQFMVSPLVFIGTSLDLSDWTTWWLLHQRARVFSVFEPEHRPPTFALTSMENPLPHLAGRPADIEQIEFRSFDELWDTFRNILER